MQWAATKDLEDCEPLSQEDFECMKELREILCKYGKLDRFALHLIHKHFDLSDDEILVEYSDSSTREQVFKVEKLDADIVEHSVPTTWTLERIEPMARCVCAKRMGKGHLGYHETGVTMESDILKSIIAA